jgi:hypothetical protein
MEMIISLIAGLVGGNVGGVAAKNLSMGPIINSVIGAIGGLGGGQLIDMLGGADAVAAAAGSMDMGALLGQAGAGGVGGLVLTLLAGMVKKAMAKA